MDICAKLVFILSVGCAKGQELLVQQDSGINRTADHSLAPWEQYLAPYVNDLVNYRESAQGRRYIFLSNVVDAIPTWIEDLFIPLFIPHSTLTIPINEKIQLSLPSSFHPKIPLPASFTLVSVTLKDLNKFKQLRPMKLLDASMFSWKTDLAMSEVALDVLLRLEVLGKSVDVTVSVQATNPALHSLLIAAWDRTKMCETWGHLLQSSSHCAVWPMFLDMVKGVAGFKFVEFSASVSDFHFSLHVSGLDDDKGVILQNDLTELLNQKKPTLLSDMPGPISLFMKTLFNLFFLNGVDKMHKEQPCPAAQWQKVDEFVDVSRVCIVNNGGFAIKFAFHECPQHLYHEASGVFPADVKVCKDVSEIYPNAVKGDTLRAATVAVAGLHEILDPAIRYIPNSNVASWECAVDGRGTYNYDCKLMSVAPVNPSVNPEASQVCVINQGGFAMWYFLHDERTAKESRPSGTYPANQQQCINMKDIQGLKEGDAVSTWVQAVAGRRKTTNRKVTYKDNGLSVSFQCKGTTLNYQCEVLTYSLPQPSVLITV
jgi:hypothetical protein